MAVAASSSASPCSFYGEEISEGEIRIAVDKLRQEGTKGEGCVAGPEVSGAAWARVDGATRAARLAVG